MKQEGPDLVVRAFDYCGLGVPEAGQLSLLREFHRWLGSEASDEGLIGGGESARLWSRHIADSVVFSMGWKERDLPNEVADLGSGAGLPGIPLAIAWPDTSIRLVDRSERRCRLLRRAVRILELGNVTVDLADASGLASGSVKGLVMRALLPPGPAVELAGRLLAPGATAVIGGGRPGPEAPPPPARLLVIPESVLDDSPSLLIMTHRA